MKKPRKDRGVKKINDGLTSAQRYRLRHPDRASESQQKYRATAKGKRTLRARYLKRYGLTPEDFDSLIATQHGLCPICWEPLDEMALARSRMITVDHDHKTGRVRGVLHRGCNMALGQLGDDYLSVQRTADYLYRHADDQRIHPYAVIGDPPQHRDYRSQKGIPPIISPTARIEAFCSVDAGTQRATTIGDRVWCMKSTHVGHDSIIGAGTEIAPMTSIGGWVEIGENVSIGQGVTIRPRRKIGDGARLGMGAVVIRDVPAGVTVAGNPAAQLLEGSGSVRRQRMASGEVFTDREEAGWEKYAATEA